MTERLMEQMKPYPSRRSLTTLRSVHGFVAESMHPVVLEELLQGSMKPSVASYLRKHANVSAQIKQVMPKEMSSRVKEEKPHFVLLSADAVTPQQGRSIVQAAKKVGAFIAVRSEGPLPKWATGAHRVEHYRAEERQALLEALLEHLRK